MYMYMNHRPTFQYFLHVFTLILLFVCCLQKFLVVSDAHCLIIGTFRSEDKDDYGYKFSDLSTRTSKNFGVPNLMRVLSTENSYS